MKEAEDTRLTNSSNDLWISPFHATLQELESGVSLGSFPLSLIQDTVLYNKYVIIILVFYFPNICMNVCFRFKSKTILNNNNPYKWVRYKKIICRVWNPLHSVLFYLLFIPDVYKAVLYAYIFYSRKKVKIL